MKIKNSLFLLFGLFQSLYSNSYIDSLDDIINQNVAILADVPSYKVNKLAYKIRKNIKSQVSLQEIEDFLDNQHSVAFFFCDAMQLKTYAMLEAQVTQEQQQAFKNLQFALGAKLYVYYLECAKQKMFYKAIKNYDALNHWENEKFYEVQPFFRKNILRSVSSFGYAEKIEHNIALIKDITKQTNSFLGLVLHNQQLLQQAKTEQEFEACLMKSVQLQDEYLHVLDQSYDRTEMCSIIKKSIDQVATFSEDVASHYAQCQMPSHLVRHWKGYTVTSIAACACAFICMRYGQDITQGTQYFWNEHVRGAVEENWKRFTGYMTEDADILNLSIESEAKEIAIYGPAKGDETSLHDALVQACDIVSNGEFSQIFQKLDKKIEEVDQMTDKTKAMIDEGDVWHTRYQEFKKEHPNMLWGDWYKYFKAMREPVFPDVYQQNSRGIAGDAISCIPLPGVWRDVSLPVVKTSLSTDSQSPCAASEQESFQETLHNASPELIHALKNQGQQRKPYLDISQYSFQDKARLVEANDKIALANPKKNPLIVPGAYARINERMLQKIQTITGIGALIPVVAVIGGSLFASKSLYNSVAYQPIRTLVRRLEVFLNEIYYEPVTLAQEGHIYFLTEQLKLNVNMLTVPEQKLIAADIAALQAPALDYVQKTNVVQRMYRTYPCLIPARV